MNRKQKIIVSITGIIIVSLALIGLTYGFFLTRVTGNPTNPSITVDLADLAVHYSEDTNVVQGANNITPGYTVTKTFNVENVGNAPAEYSIKLKDIVSTFTRYDDWTYVLTRNGDEIASGIIPSMDVKVLVSVETIPIDTTYNYELTLTYANLTNVNQSEDMDKTIYMTVNIDQTPSTWDKKLNISKPKLAEGMIPLKWNNSKGKWVVCEETDPEWYDFDRSLGSTQKLWPNVMLSDGYYTSEDVEVGQLISVYETGSMFVWIPRYEYKITNQTIDVNFIPLNQTIASSGYKIHPAFVSNVDVGGWDTELNGIWFAKYEAAYQANMITSDYLNPNNKNREVVYSNLYYSSTAQDNPENGNVEKLNALKQDLGLNNFKNERISYPSFVISSYSYNLINISDMYLVSRDMARSDYYGLKNVDTHLMKNTEWGAAAYLTHSVFGRNGTEIAVNSMNANPNNANNELANIDVFTLTGYSGTNRASNNTYSSASTTGNMTGIFDMSGGSNERVAMYSTGYDAVNARENFGQEVAYYDGELSYKDTKYATHYNINHVDGGGHSVIFNEFVNSQGDIRYGDAVIETILDPFTDGGSWNGDDAKPAIQNGVFTVRGGRMDAGTKAGIFSINHNNGNAASSKTGFRVALVVE